MKPIVYKEEKKTSKVVLMFQVFIASINIVLLKCSLVLLKILSVCGLILRTAIYTVLIKYIIIPLSPWSDIQIKFVVLWLTVLIVIGIMKTEQVFKYDNTKVRKDKME